MTQVTKVPLLDLSAQYNTIKIDIEAAIQRVIQSQSFILGSEVQSFEKELEEYIGNCHAVTCASGSDALLLALMALNIQPGDEVICPTYTFFATAGCVSRLGAKPVFADIDRNTFNLTADSVRKAASSCRRLRAIIVVHLFGRAAPMDELEKVAQKLEVPIVEDAAQAIGTRDSRGFQTGSMGHIAAFSFFPSKNLGGFGDGGLITTPNPDLAEKLRILRAHGAKPKYHHSMVGINSRLDALQAAVLRVKLQHLENWHTRRIDNAMAYNAAWMNAGANCDDSQELTAGSFKIPAPVNKPARHIYNQYVVRVHGSQRKAVLDNLKNAGVGTEIYYPLPMHLQPCFSSLGHKAGDFPQSEAAALESFALPIYPELLASQRDHVIKSVINAVKQTGER